MEHFLAVVDKGGFSAAARALYVAQPSLSQSVRKLEEGLGVLLFDRGSSGVSLTAAGEHFEAPARNLMSRVARTQHVAAEIAGLGVGQLALAATGTLATDPLPALLRQFNSLHPGIRFRIVDPLTHKALLEAVRSGQVDLGLTDMSHSDPSLLWHHLGSQEIVIVLAPQHSGLPPGPLSPSDLDGLEFVVPSTGSSDRLIRRRAIGNRPVRVAVECATWGSVMSLVRSGAGSTFLSRTVAERHFDTTLVRSLEPPLLREVGLVHRGAALTATAAAFVSTVLSAPELVPKSTSSRASGPSISGS